ncbi:MAG: hypothetical protein AAFW97_01855 [Pseudomonadota bacterium]
MTSREKRRRLADERWPEMSNLLACHLGQDWPEEYGDRFSAIDGAMKDYPLDYRQLVAKQWRNWIAQLDSESSVKEYLNDYFGINIYFKSEFEAVEFADEIYRRLIDSIKDETSGKYLS